MTNKKSNINQNNIRVGKMESNVLLKQKMKEKNLTDTGLTKTIRLLIKFKESNKKYVRNFYVRNKKNTNVRYNPKLCLSFACVFSRYINLPVLD